MSNCDVNGDSARNTVAPSSAARLDAPEDLVIDLGVGGGCTNREGGRDMRALVTTLGWF